MKIIRKKEIKQKPRQKSKQRRKQTKVSPPRSKLKKKKKTSRKNRTIRRIFRDTIIAMVLAMLIALMVSNFFFNITTVRGFSMISTLREGDVVLVKKTTDLKRFDLAAFSNQNNSVQIRRIIGLPGEKISYQTDTLYIDDQRIDEKFIVDEINQSQRSGKNYTEDFTTQDLTSAMTIPEGYYLVLGDNRPYATDSRVYGLVSVDNIIGKAVVHFLPFNNLQIF